MEFFYEVRRQLQNPIQWAHSAYFRNRENAEAYVKYKLDVTRRRNPDFVNINFEIDKHKFGDETLLEGLARRDGAKKSEKTAWQEAESVVYCSMKVTVEVISPDAKVASLVAKVIKARVNKDGLMGSKSRIHRVKKGKGSYQRRPKHQ